MEIMIIEHSFWIYFVIIAGVLFGLLRFCVTFWDNRVSNAIKEREQKAEIASKLSRLSPKERKILE